MTNAAEVSIKVDPEAGLDFGTEHHNFDRAWEDFENGFPTPIIVDQETGYIYDGNHRYAVAEETGTLDQLPVVAVTEDEWFEFCDESGWWDDTDSPEPEMAKDEWFGF